MATFLREIWDFDGAGGGITESAQTWSGPAL